jgi:hypothetical protein
LLTTQHDNPLQHNPSHPILLHLLFSCQYKPQMLLFTHDPKIVGNGTSLNPK